MIDKTVIPTEFLFYLCVVLPYVRSYGTCSHGILCKMNWVYLCGGQKSGAYVLNEDGKSLTEKYGAESLGS